MATVYGKAPSTRVTSLDATGAAVCRWTLQPTIKEGRSVSWVPEGTLAVLGSASSRQRSWAHKGFRQELSLRWAAGTTSLVETWTGSSWSSPVTITTAQAHADILQAAAHTNVLVEPFLGSTIPSFAALVTERGPSLSDNRGAIHSQLQLVLSGLGLVDGITLAVLSTLAGWGIGPWCTNPWGSGASVFGFGDSEFANATWGD